MESNKIIFVTTRNPDTGEGFLSYKEFFLLARLSGFQIIQKEQMDLESDNTYIISYFEMADYIAAPRKCKLIFWNLERNICSKEPEIFDEVWVSDRSLLYGSNAKYVICGGVKNIYPDNPVKIYDFAYMANDGVSPDHAKQPGRRKVQYDRLRDLGFALAPAPYEDEKYGFLAQSKAGLCLHQDEQLYIEPIRYAIFSSFGLPLLCEKSTDYYPYTIYSYEEWIQNPDISVLKENNYELMTGELSFFNCIMEALK